MLRVASLDDHPALRAGVEAIVHRESDLAWAGAAAGPADLWPLLRRSAPDVVVLDVDHPGEDGLQLTLRLKSGARPPRVVLYSSHPGGELAVAALVAGADAVVSKSDTSRALLDAIRGADDDPDARAIPPTVMASAAERLEPTDRAILAMRLAGTTRADIAQTIGVRASDVAARIAAIVARLAFPSGARPAAT